MLSLSKIINTGCAAQAHAPLSTLIHSTTGQVLWSSLAEVAELLDCTVSQAMLSEATLFQHLHFRSGQRIYVPGQNFDALFLVHSGFLKTTLLDEWGNEQGLNFPMKGDVMGIESMHCGQYSCEAVALSDCDIIVLPSDTMIQFCHRHQQLEHTLFALMSRELARQQQRLSLHGSASAEARVGRFLLALAERFHALGYAKTSFNLRMTRNDIGNYLGLTLETVSRSLSGLNELGLITVNQRQITIHDAKGLATLKKLPSQRLKAKLNHCLRAAQLAACLPEAALI